MGKIIGLTFDVPVPVKPSGGKKAPPEDEKKKE